ncbi:DUF4328 domain-containing protein [Streptomyces sp. NBC_01304]|uniref:DUF4328 domain-containing protein n=1 Tax=Streptomyces sp. NBC_01304 TaxID=2903818 RepID=UPI002E106A88|nr:DUF4328 domain-containing protein [Streptomyces sp. NBC_01304]
MSQMPVAPPPPPEQYRIAPSAALRSPVGLSKAVVAVLGLVIATDLFAVWQGFASWDLFERILGHGSYTLEEADRADTLYAASGVAQVAALIAAAVVFIVWFHRARVNAEVFAPEYHAKKRGWVIWGWFVPVVNLWFPKQIASDIWNASTIEGSNRSRGLLNAWWTVWIVNLVYGRFATQRYMKAEEAADIKQALMGVVVSDLIDIAAAVLAIVFVARLTRMQHEKALRGPGEPLPMPGRHL